MPETSTLKVAGLDEEQQALAKETVRQYLEAWKRQAWGTMSTHCQTPQAVGVGEAEMCTVLEQRLSTNHLEEIGDLHFERGNMEDVGDAKVGFADFKVALTIRGKRVGIILRAVHNGKRWGVNFTSMNRRFAVEKES